MTNNTFFDFIQSILRLNRYVDTNGGNSDDVIWHE